MARGRSRLLTAGVVGLAIAAGALGYRFARGPLLRALAQRHLARAERLISAGDDAHAADELGLALDSDPLVPRAQRLLGEVHLRGHQLESAFLALQAATEAFPEEAEGFSDLARVRQEAAQPEQAEAALTNAIERAPLQTDLRLRRAALRLALGRAHGALLDAQAALQKDPGSVEARETSRRAGALLDPAQCRPPAGTQPPAVEAAAWPGRLGPLLRDFLAATHRKDWAAASALVSRARSEYPCTMLGPWLDGAASQGFGDLEHAEQVLREALAIAPRSHRPITNLAAVWARQGGPARVAAELLALAARDPGFTYPLPIAAAAQLQEAQPAKAEATIRRMFLLQPGSPVPFREVARFLLRLDRPSDAIATAAQGLARFPEDPELLQAQARGYLLLGDRDAAARAWEAVLAARPDDQVAAAQLLRLSIARKTPASRARALALVRTLSCDAPADPEVLGALGLALLQEAGDAHAALPWLLAAWAGAPGSPQRRYELALAQVRTGDAKSARSGLVQALGSGEVFEEEPEARRLLHDLEARSP